MSRLDPTPLDRSAVAFAAVVAGDAARRARPDDALDRRCRSIAGDLGALSDVSWVVTAYVVAAAAVTPLWGKLGDRLGRKRMLEVALGRLRRRVRAVRRRAGHHAADRAAARPGHRRRRADGARDGGRRRPGRPRERGRYQGYIAATFAVATVVGPLLGGVLVEHASWRWVFLVNLPVGALALAGLRLRLPAAAVEPPARPLDALGAALLAGATSTLMLVCIWGGGRFAWGSPEILALIAATLVLVGGAVLRERRAADPIVPLRCCARARSRVASAALFLATAALFAITVFVPLFLQTTTGATPTEAGLLLVPAMLGITVRPRSSGRSIARTGRYKRFPVAGLALMSGALRGWP